MAFETLLAGNSVLLGTDKQQEAMIDNSPCGGHGGRALAIDSLAERSAVKLSDTYGLWRRSWLKSPTRFDASTHVMWMQANELHVDIRLPEGTAEMESSSCLAALEEEQLRLLATAEGFAGKTSVNDSVCTWARRINFQGPLKGLDIGTLTQTPDGLLETGLYANYDELWQQLTDDKPQERLMSDNHGRSIVILWTRNQFALGRGWHERTVHNRSLPEHVDYALGRQDKAALARAFDQEFCFGRIEDGEGIVEHSTQPMRKGTTAFKAVQLLSNAAGVEFNLIDFFGESSYSTFKTSNRCCSARP